MCDLCENCKTECDCPRCPLQEKRREIQQCAICGMDDRECKDEYCAVQEHCLFSGQMYCKLCVESKYGFELKMTALGMYCDEHEDAHKEKMRAKVISRVVSRQVYESM